MPGAVRGYLFDLHSSTVLGTIYELVSTLYTTN
uniref:Uncharacterized protein n=1 Tax=Moniliophthora roreri TaxID=221103 RepID=A0A0W0FCB4_MONRR